jgi:GH24 family phage-related lysozyme (muramidase)
MQVAAQTIGLDLVPVVPMPGPLGLLTYLDFVYAGGKLDSKEAPLFIKVDADFISGGISAFVEGTTYYAKTASGATDNVYAFTYVGDSRIDGYSIFRVVATDADGTLRNVGAAGLVTINTAVSTGSLYDAIGASTEVATYGSSAELVKALEDHISGFSGKAARLGDGTGNSPYSRNEGESEPDNLMGLTLYNKSVEAKTIQAAAAVTREQVQDLKQYGIDAVAQVESVLINELTQTINKLILDRIFALGATNHTRSSVNLNLNFGTTAANIDLGLGEDGNPVALMNTAATTTFGGDTTGSVQRKILSKILGAANLIAIRGRRGAANFAVTNGQVATALQDIAGFTPYPLSNTINQSAGSLYPVCSVAGVNIYVDPNMDWNDTRIAIGRKGDGNSTGVVFMPYLMADSVSTIAEGTMAPKIAIKSRFALVDAGHHPELNYFTLKVQVGANFPSLV